MTTKDGSQFNLLSRYLGGLSESRKLWIGYRMSNSGSRIGLEGDRAPDIVQYNGNFNGSTSGNSDSCIGIQTGKFIIASCSQRLPFICTIVYDGRSHDSLSKAI